MATTEKLRISGTQGITMQLALYVLDCAACGVVFGITTEYEERRRDDGIAFHCPNGHVNSWQETAADRERKARIKAEKLAQQLEEDRSRYQEWLRKEREAHKATERRRAAAKGQLTKAKKRAAAALCPCCNRSFVQLRRHLETKHPEYSGEVAADANT